MKYQEITLYPSISKGIELFRPVPHYTISKRYILYVDFHLIIEFLQRLPTVSFITRRSLFWREQVIERGQSKAD